MGLPSLALWGSFGCWVLRYVCVYCAVGSGWYLLVVDCLVVVSDYVHFVVRLPLVFSIGGFLGLGFAGVHWGLLFCFLLAFGRACWYSRFLCGRLCFVLS